MPTYDYECKKCGHTFDEFQSMSDDPLTTCPTCGRKSLRRLIGGGLGIIFKGSGFYATDSRAASGNNNGQGAKDGSKKESSSEAASTSSDSSPGSSSDSSSGSSGSSDSKSGSGDSGGSAKKSESKAKT